MIAGTILFCKELISKKAFDLIEDGNVKECIISNSKEVFLLVEKEKFNLDSTYKYANIEDFDAIITYGGY